MYTIVQTPNNHLTASVCWTRYGTSNCNAMKKTNYIEIVQSICLLQRFFLSYFLSMLHWTTNSIAAKHTVREYLAVYAHGFRKLIIRYFSCWSCFFYSAEKNCWVLCTFFFCFTILHVYSYISASIPKNQCTCLQDTLSVLPFNR